MSYKKFSETITVIMKFINKIRHVRLGSIYTSNSILISIQLVMYNNRPMLKFIHIITVRPLHRAYRIVLMNINEDATPSFFTLGQSWKIKLRVAWLLEEKDWHNQEKTKFQLRLKNQTSTRFPVTYHKTLKNFLKHYEHYNANMKHIYFPKN